MKYIRRFLPVTISLILIVALISYAPWGEVATTLSTFKITSIISLVLLSLCYYALKTLRFWYLLQAIGIKKPLGLVTLSYMAAQPVSLLPAGEIYRSHELRRQTGVPLEQSLPQFAMQGLLEGAAMAIIMLISAIAVGTLRLPALILAGVVVIALVGISRGHISNFTKLFKRLPFFNIADTRLERFSQRHEAVLSRQWLPLLLTLSLLVELAGTAIAYVSVSGIGGHITVYQAALVYIIPVIVGFISLLPGGFGLSEQSAIGVLLLSKLSVRRAVAATLVMRVSIVGLGVLYGVIFLLAGRIRLWREASS